MRVRGPNRQGYFNVFLRPRPTNWPRLFFSEHWIYLFISEHLGSLLACRSSNSCCPQSLSTPFFCVFRLFSPSSPSSSYFPSSLFISSLPFNSLLLHKFISYTPPNLNSFLYYISISVAPKSSDFFSKVPPVYHSLSYPSLSPALFLLATCQQPSTHRIL